MIGMHRPGRRRPRRLNALCADRRAATAVEYGLILALIVLAVFGSIAAVGGQTSSMWNNIHDAVITAH